MFNHHVTFYVERCGGRFEARYRDSDGVTSFQTGSTPAEAIFKLRKYTGYTADHQVGIVFVR